MATLTVDLPPGPALPYPKVSIVSETGITVTLPYAPNEVEHKGHSGTFTQQQRPGRDPLLQVAGGRLTEMTFTATVVRPDGASIDDVLYALVVLIAANQRVRVGYTLLSGGLWRITDDTITELDHEPGTNRCIKATVALTFTRASDAAVRLGPASGGASSGGAAQTVTARGGESGAALVARTNSTATKPKTTATKKSTSATGQLADANGVRDLRRVPAGQTIRPTSDIIRRGRPY
jgi:hypothetical protein